MDGSRDTGTLSGPRTRTMRPVFFRELLRTGPPLTVPAAAELAGVSERATAYRYLRNNDAVVLHATMSLADNPLDDRGLGLRHGRVTRRARCQGRRPRTGDGNMGFRPRDRTAHDAAPFAHA